MKITIQQSYKYDVKAERDRINRSFSGDRRKFHLALLRSFEEFDIDKFEELWDNAPENKKWETTELEWVGGYADIMWKIINGVEWRNSNGVTKCKVKVIDINRD